MPNTTPTAIDAPPISSSRVKRYGLASAGVACVGMGGIGTVVPGLPTTVFLLMATWCFARSCPWLTDRLVRNRFFSPFACYLVPGVVMPRRAKIISIAMMWAAITVSCAVLLRSEAPVWVPGVVVLSGVAGTWFIARQGRKIRRAALGSAPQPGTARVLRHPVGRQQREHKPPAAASSGQPTGA